MINPNKYIRQAILQAFPDIKMWANLVPASVNPQPAMYGIISSMSKTETAVSKTCYEWNVTFDLDLFNVGAKGFDHSTPLDDLAQVIIPRMKQLTSGTVDIKNVFLEIERDMTMETATNTISRKILSYSCWVSYSK